MFPFHPRAVAMVGGLMLAAPSLAEPPAPPPPPPSPVPVEWCSPAAQQGLAEGLAYVRYPRQAGGATVSGRIDLRPQIAPPRGGTPYPAQGAAVPGPPPPQIAVVYLEGDFAPELLRPPAEPLSVAQRELQFSPATLPVLVGTQVAFPNLDDTYHNVFSYSPTKKFDLGRFQKGEMPPPVLLDQTGPVRIFCEVHEHMRGVILVLPTPYFTVTDTDGRYCLDGVPPGRYLLRVWLSERRQWQQEVDLAPGGEVSVNLPK